MLAGAAEMLTAKLAEYPIVTEVNHDFQTGQPQNDVRLNEVGRAMGLDARSLARQLRGKFYGIESKRQLRDRDEVIILVRGTERERTNMHAFENTLVKTPSGTFVPLHRVATVERGRAYTKIERRHGARVVDVDADITPPSMTNHIIRQVEEVIMPGVLERFPGLVKRYSGRQQEDRRSVGSLLWTFPLALLVIFALLAVPFGSYSLGLMIVGMTVPFGFVGAMLGHIVMGYSLTIPGLLGFIALSGVLVNDSLILVDFAERQRRRGSSAGEAARAAALQRFRPIVLTTVTTFAGLAPMIFETSRQARFLIPMAISLGFGLVFATAMVLLMLPAMYLLLDRMGRLPPVS
jgi:multidrug efflux pump subunit AcrB